MATKKAENLFIEDGSYYAPALRGAFESWLDRDWSLPGGQSASIKVRDDHTEWVNSFRSFESWLDRRVDDDWYSDVKEEYGNDKPKEIFHDYWESNDEFRQGVEEHIEYVTIEGDPGDTGDSGSPSSDGGGDEDSGQSSFGESEFPELYDLGVVDDEGMVVEAKFRGLFTAFVKDVEEIKGEADEANKEAVKWAFLYWGKHKFGEEWIRLVHKYIDKDPLGHTVNYIIENKDEIVDMLRDKYRGGQDVSVGNRDTDDLSEAFLDREVPGWDDDDNDSNNEDNLDRWEKYEQDSAEREGDGQGRKEEEDRDDEKGKWEKFERKSEEQAHGDGVRDRKGDCCENPENGDISSNSGGSDSGSLNTINDWTKREGKADRKAFMQRKRDREVQSGNDGRISNGGGETSSGDGGGVSQQVECEDSGRLHEIKWPEVSRMDELEKSRIYEGNTYEWAMKLPKDSIDTIVTSPPYYALRDYDIEDAYPISGDFSCDHDWHNEFCRDCGAFLGQLGHEPDPATFVEHIVDLMDRYKEVLKPSGSLWLNIGDTYAGEDIDGRVKAKNKSRMMIPERVYRRMVQTGWHLRDYVIWVKKIWMPDDDLKGNGKPFASSNRLADQWEPMVRFTQEPDHYSDVDSNRLLPPSFDGDLGSEGIEGKFREGEDTQRGKTYNELGTNPPDVWLINSDGYDGDHRAVFPEELPKRCINVSTPDKVCSNCGRPYDKEVHINEGSKLSAGGDYATYDSRCHCSADDEPGVAFDPFLGSGTTAVAAANNGFNWAGVELSEKYAELARDRIPKGRQVGINQW